MRTTTGLCPGKPTVKRVISGFFAMLLLLGGGATLTACLDPDATAPAQGEALPGSESADDTSAEKPSTGEDQQEEPSPRSEPIALKTEATLRSVVDGDTVKTSEGAVRIIGIDTPELGECGFTDASHLIRKHIGAGDSITLVLPAGQNDTDRHGRLLRSVKSADGLDIGRAQLEAGNAVARYDSHDGYPSHPEEDLYRSLTRATLDADGRVVTASCASGEATASPLPTPKPTETPSEQGSGSAGGSPQWADGGWYTQYRSCSALKRDPKGNPTGPFNRDIAAETPIYNWFQYGTGYQGDGDGDGLACE